MRGRRSLVLIFLVAVLVSMVVVDLGTSAPEVVLYVDPSVSSAPPLGTFDVNVTVGVVEDLFLSEFFLRFDPSLLEAVDAVRGDFETLYLEEIDNDAGIVHLVAGRPVGVFTGLSGTLVLAKISFLVKAEGSGTLYLYDPSLKAAPPDGDITIDRMVDGYFANAHHCYSCDENGALKDVFPPGETFYVRGGLFPETLAPVEVDVYVLVNTEWVDGQEIGAPVRQYTQSVHENGTLPVTDLGAVGFYDIVVDYNRNGYYDEASDAVDDVTSWSGVTAPRHDIAIISVVPNATEIFLEDVLPFNVTIVNEGTFAETFNVTAYYDDTAIETRTGVSLSAKGTEILELVWNSKGVLPGALNISAQVDLAPVVDDDPADNWNYVTIEAKPAWGSIKGEVRSKTSDLLISFATVTAVGPETHSNTTGPDGTYLLADLLVADYNVTVSKAGYKDVVRLGDVDNGTARTLNVKLQPLVEMGWVQGYVTEEKAGQPMDRATVTTEGYAAFTSSSGFYKIEIIPGTYNMTAEMAGYFNETEYDVIVSAGLTTTINFTMVSMAPGWIEGYVTDKKTGIAIVGATVTAKGYSNTTDETGYYKIELLPGTYDVRASAADYFSETKTGILVESEATTTVDFTLTHITHDVAVVSVIPSITEVFIGELVTINVTVRNEGGFRETFNVTAYYDDVAIEAKTVELLVNRNATITFTWNTTDISRGAYTIKANATVVEGETEVDDNTFTDGIVTVLVHDITVTSVAASPTEVIVGESVSINVTIENQGDFSKIFNVTITYDGNFIANQTNVLLTLGANTTLSFTWVTIGVETGDYSIIAEAIVEVDNDPADNVNHYDFVTVRKLSSSISITASPTSITVGESITISGSINLTRVGATVTILYRMVGETWDTLAIVITNGNSQYSYTWTPRASGTYEVKASWPGDESTLPDESDVQTITVHGEPLWNLLPFVAAGVVAILAIVGIVLVLLRVKKPKKP